MQTHTHNALFVSNALEKNKAGKRDRKYQGSESGRVSILNRIARKYLSEKGTAEQSTKCEGVYQTS
jgi:hypothetical protein